MTGGHKEVFKSDPARNRPPCTVRHGCAAAPSIWPVSVTRWPPISGYPSPMDIYPRERLPRLAVVSLAWLLAIDLLTRFHVGPISLSGALTIATAVLCVLYVPLLELAAKKNWRSFRHSLRPDGAVPWPLIIFVGYAWIRLMLSPSVEGVQNVAVFTGFVGTIWVSSLRVTNSQAISMLRFLRFISVVVPLVFIIGFIAGVNTYGARAFALSCILFVAILIPYRGNRLIYRFGPALVVVAAFLSLSRSAGIITAALLIFLAARSRPRHRLPVATLVGLTVSAVIYWVITFYTPFRDRFLGGDQAVSVGRINFNTSGRSALWEVTWESAMRAPWIGHGPAAITPILSSKLNGIAHPHNDYLRLIHDYGLIGTCFFVFGILMLMWRIIQSIRRTDDQIHWAAFIALFGVSIAAITDNVIVYVFVMIPLGAIIGYSLSRPFPLKQRIYRTARPTHGSTKCMKDGHIFDRRLRMK